MDNNTDSFEDEFESDDECTCEGDDEDMGEDIPYVPPTPKEKFQSTITQIRGVASASESTYAALIQAIEPFDKGLVAKLQECKRADEALFAYLESKVESLPPGVVAGLISR